MSERKLKPEDASTHKIMTIKRELDQTAQEKMRLNQIKYGNISIGRALLRLLHNIIKEYSTC